MSRAEPRPESGRYLTPESTDLNFDRWATLLGPVERSLAHHTYMLVTAQRLMPAALFGFARVFGFGSEIELGPEPEIGFGFGFALGFEPALQAPSALPSHFARVPARDWMTARALALSKASLSADHEAPERLSFGWSSLSSVFALSLVLPEPPTLGLFSYSRMGWRIEPMRQRLRPSRAIKWGLPQKRAGAADVCAASLSDKPGFGPDNYSENHPENHSREQPHEDP